MLDRQHHHFVLSLPRTSGLLTLITFYQAAYSLSKRAQNPNQNQNPNFILIIYLLCGFPILFDTKMATTLGGIQESRGDSSQNSVEIDSLAKFAVEEHNKRENAVLEFGRVVKAREQVVAGTLHHLTIEAIEAGEKKLYEAKVWVKQWLNFKELQEFKHAGDASRITPSDLGAKKGEPSPGWKAVPVHDPSVQDAANHAVKTIQQKSNSLFPYELQEVVDAKAEVIDESAKYEIILKVTRGNNEEKFKVEVHKNNEGGFHLNHMEPHA